MQFPVWALVAPGAFLWGLPFAAIRKTRRTHAQLRRGRVAAVTIAGTSLLALAIGWYALPVALLTAATLLLRTVANRRRRPAARSTEWALNTPTHKHTATRDLLDVRAGAARAAFDHQGLRVSVVTADTHQLVAFEPRSNFDRLPWVTYDPARGVRRLRYSSAECITIPVTSGDQDSAQRIDRSILARLEAAGIHCAFMDDRGGRLALQGNSSVAVGPGATVFTVMSRPRNSRARIKVIDSTAPLSPPPGGPTSRCGSRPRCSACARTWPGAEQPTRARSECPGRWRRFHTCATARSPLRLLLVMVPVWRRRCSASRGRADQQSRDRARVASCAAVDIDTPPKTEGPAD
jgi:hypothetical protein